MAAYACPSFATGHQNMTIKQGDDYSAGVHVYQSDGITDADITGYIARAQIRLDVADVAEDVIIEIVTTVQSPLISLSIPRSLTSTLTQSNYVWDLELLSPTDVLTTILSGGVSVIPEVTREVVARRAVSWPLRSL